MAGGGLRDINISDSRRQYAHAQQTTGCFSPRQKLIGLKQIIAITRITICSQAAGSMIPYLRFIPLPGLPHCTVMLMVCLKMTPAESLACTVRRCAPVAIVTIVSSEPPVFVKIALPSR